MIILSTYNKFIWVMLFASILCFAAINPVICAEPGNDLETKFINATPDAVPILTGTIILGENDSMGPEETLIPPVPQKKGELLTLDECLQLAYDKHPNIAQKRAAIAYQQAKLKQSLALYDPVASLDLSKTYNALESITDRETNAGVNITQTIYDSNQRKKQVESDREALLASILDLKSAWVTQAEAVNQAYLNVILQGKLVFIQKDDFDKATNNLKVARGFYNAGAKPKIDVTQAEVEAAQSKISLEQLETAYENALISLASAMAVSLSDIKDANMEDIMKKSFELPPIVDAMKIMEKSNPDLLQLEARVRSQIALAQAIDNQLKPVLSGQGGYGYQGADNPQDTAWNLMLKLSVPIFQINTVSSQSDQQRALADQYAKQRDSQLLSYRQQLQTSYANINGAMKNIDTARDQVKQAMLNFNLAYMRYKQGISTIIELNNARDYLNQARYSYINSVYNLKYAENSLLQTLGKPDFPLPADKQKPEEKAKKPEKKK